MKLKFRAIGDVPTGLPPGLSEFLQALKENQEILIGQRKRGAVASRATLNQDLIDMGVITKEDLPDV
jgi:hypothetical protein